MSLVENVVPEQYESIEDVELDVFERMSDRELLVSIARDIHATKHLVAGGVEQIAPIMQSPALKMMSKFLPKGA